MEHEFEDMKVGVQDDGFPILSVDKSHTCNANYKLVTPVMERQFKELMKSTGFGYPGRSGTRGGPGAAFPSYSGSWKRKMQLCAAQLMYGDALLL